ncbi:MULTISPECIES: inositol 2-dehydrogenase [Legionella]|uniref:Myo-inositol-2-dehydrogenase n=1 Tax=Legionella drozanskii LLAP-1 TaxID=1212489 RepID=A0A0W0SWV8_9GAMM|nr:MULTISPECIES: inositol 2-dehydrogenase [Legionella]KTC87740.1 myo-inositol-2-dehydrogenase [Legionella drozanskii LLAP-1]PJE12343.1 MAG: inositol 2-dehydrogenase [Legionella sp.]
MNKKCKIGIIGAGRIGKLHATNIKYRLPQFEVAAIADPNLDENWAKSLDISIIGSCADELIFNKDLDALLLASPSNLHCAQIKAASNAGKAIFCEKPIGLSEEEIRSALEVVEGNKTLLQLGFNRRFDPSFASLQKKLKSGAIGNSQLIRITSRDPVCPSKEYCATSGGMLMDMTIHDFDMARFLTASEVVEVYAMGAILINPDFEAYNDIDTAIIQLRFANGALGVIDNSRQAVYGYDQRIEAFGSQGMLLAENQLNNSVKTYSAQQSNFANPLYFFLERYEQAFIAELTAFYESWTNKASSVVSGFDGLQAHLIAKAAKQSLETNLPVSLKG